MCKHYDNMKIEGAQERCIKMLLKGGGVEENVRHKIRAGWLKRFGALWMI